MESHAKGLQTEGKEVDNSLIVRLADLSSQGLADEILMLTETLEEEVTSKSQLVGTAYFYRGYALGLKGDKEGATRMYMCAERNGLKTFGNFFNLANTLRVSGRTQDALSYYKKCLGLNQETWPIKTNMAECYEALGDMETAYRLRMEAYVENKDNSICRCNLSYSLLRKGDYEEGLRLYESRDFSVPDVRLTPTLRIGQSIEGKRLLIAQEQGIGDVVMFAGLIPLITRISGNITIVCNRQLRDVLQRGLPDVVVTSEISEEEIRDHDIILGMSSLGYIAHLVCGGFKQVEPYLKVSQEKKKRLYSLLEPRERKKIIGIAWRGGSTLEDQKRRSVPLKSLISALDLQRYTLVNLQYGDTKREVEDARMSTGAEIIDLLDATYDIDGVLAAIECVDTLITVQQSLVHFSAAIGKGIRVLVPYVPEWRYGLESSKMPWWGSPILYRQEELGCWKAPFRKLAKDLEKL